MAAISRSRRATAGIAFLVAGVVIAIAAILPLLGISSVPWLFLIGYAALAVGLVILAIGAVNATIAKIALFAGAVGWIILVLGGIGIVLPAVVTTTGAVLAALGTLIGAIVLYAGREIVNRSAIAFVIAALLATLFLLGYLGVFPLGAFGTIVTIAFGVAFAITGFLFRATERKR